MKETFLVPNIKGEDLIFKSRDEITEKIRNKLDPFMVGVNEIKIQRFVGGILHGVEFVEVLEEGLGDRKCIFGFSG